ncbi:MAG: hypothetical protein MHM6MM_002550 [Cercozoa sp. M6MM]
MVLSKPLRSALSANKPLLISLVALGVAAKLLNERADRQMRQTRRKEAAHADSLIHEGESEENRKRKGRVDKRFWKRVRKLLRLCIRKREIALLGTLSAILVLRTFLSIKISDVNGSIVKSIVDRDFAAFLRKLGVLATLAVPSSTVNSALKYLNNTIALSLRRRLTEHYTRRYMEGNVFYQVTNVDARIANPDQALTQTIKEWSMAAATLYSDVSKPLLDIVLFSLRLRELMGWQGPGAVVLYYIVSGMLLRLLSPSFGRLHARTQQLEGELRHANHSVITSAEQIAFYGGGKWELGLLLRKLRKVVSHLRYLFAKQFWTGISDGMLVKYGSTLTGYAVLGLPVFGRGKEQYLKEVGGDQSRITQDYIRNSSLLINLAKAIGRIVVSYKQLQQLAGYTSLVSDLDATLEDLSQGRYKRQMVDSTKLKERGLAPGTGTVIDAEHIRFSDVPIVTPNGDILVNELNLTIERRENLFIRGPNGCGKSSLFRTLSQLWPQFGGVLERPTGSSIFYIPQQPYLPLGTLRDQVIYPDTVATMKCSDDELLQLLKIAKLEYLVPREGGWDAVASWQDRLSGGEKQRIAMARLFYHKPHFAILDECTSAVSVDVEHNLYSTAREMGMSLITISHRPSLWKYHERVLDMDGRGGWKVSKMVLPEGYGKDASVP